jgi:hypothetical protein
VQKESNQIEMTGGFDVVYRNDSSSSYEIEGRGNLEIIAMIILKL